MTSGERWCTLRYELSVPVGFNDISMPDVLNTLDTAA